MYHGYSHLVFIALDDSQISLKVLGRIYRLPFRQITPRTAFYPLLPFPQQIYPDNLQFKSSYLTFRQFQQLSKPSAAKEIELMEIQSKNFNDISEEDIATLSCASEEAVMIGRHNPSAF